MSETEDWSRHGLQAQAVARTRRKLHYVAFSRGELNQILCVYGRKVIDGEWRDYAIDHLEDRAVFSIFRRTSEMPIYRIEKVPALARRQGAYRIVAATGAVVRRGADLASALRVLDRPRLVLVKG